MRVEIVKYVTEMWGLLSMNHRADSNRTHLRLVGRFRTYIYYAKRSNFVAVVMIL